MDARPIGSTAARRSIHDDPCIQAELERPRLFGDEPVAAPPPRERATLEAMVSGAWEALLAGRPAPCPVCHGELQARFGAGPVAVAGRCRSCGSQLG